MTNHVIINNTVPRIRYVSNGILATYSFPFAIFKNSDLKVYFGSELQEASTYSVSGAGQSDGGSVTLSVIPTSGVIITLTRELSIERTTDFQEGGVLRAETLNNELDYQIACQQQIADNLNRSMVLPPYVADINVNLTLPTPSAGKAIVWNSEGTNLENSTVSVNAMESTLNGYKVAAESASVTATTKATEAINSAQTATTKATEAAASALEAATTLASKSNIGLDNLNPDGKKIISSMAMPSDTYIDLSVATDWNDYKQAPANGYLFIQRSGTGNLGVSISSTNDDSGIVYMQCVTDNALTGNGKAVAAPIRKNQYYKFWGSMASTVHFFRFTYAQGEI